MTTTEKSILAGVIALVLAGGVFGGYRYLLSGNVQVTAASPAGSNFNSAKAAGQVPTTGTTTAYSVQNTDSNDRTIKSSEIVLKGGISTSTNTSIACATSSSPYTLGGNTNYILNMTFSAAANSLFGTTTGLGLYVASSSPGQTGVVNAAGVVATSTLATAIRTWPASSYLVCLVTTVDGSNYFNSGIGGLINFPYLPQ